MKKKIVLLAATVLFVISVLVCIALDDAKDTGVHVADTKKIEQIKAKSELSDMAFLLCYEGEELPYDAASHTFYLPLDMEESDWEEGKLSGYFVEDSTIDKTEATNGSDSIDENNDGNANANSNSNNDDSNVVSNSEKNSSNNISKIIKSKLLFMQDYTTTDKQLAIANGRSFSFLALGKNGYGEYNLVFTGLPMITFRGTEYTADDGSQMFALTVYDTDHDGDWVTTCYTKSRLRGNTSLTYEKKSLRLYLKEKKDDGTFEKCNKNLLGLRDDDDWILNALYADNTRIRDQLCIDLWNEVGAKDQLYGYNYGTDSAMVEVFINDGYQGIYDLMIPIDAKQLGLRPVSEQLTQNTDVVERIYKKKYSREWLSSDFVGELPDPNSPDYRGGFYLKGDTILQNEQEWEPLYRIADALGSDEKTFASEITEYNDQQNLIDNWLFYQAIAGFDNENKNYYYVVRNRDGKEYGYFIPWDMNISFGMVYADNVYFSEELAEIATEPVTWQPAQRMIELDVDNSKELLQRTWNKWRNSTFSDEAIIERIQELEHKVKDSGAFKREDARYPNGNQKEDFSYIYDFAVNRLAYVDGYVEELCR